MIVMEDSGTTRAPQREDAAASGQQAPAAYSPPAGQPERQGGSSPDSQPRGAPWRRRRGQGQPAPPWRVEGVPDDKQDQPGNRRKWSRFWWTLLALLIINWI